MKILSAFREEIVQDTERNKFLENAKSDHGQLPQYRFEYIKQSVEIAREDARHVLLNVSFCVAAIAALLTQADLRPQSGSALEMKSLYIASLLSFLLASGLFFSYIRALHLLQMRLVRNIISLDIFRARELIAGESGVWAQHGWKYSLGRIVMVFALLLICTLIIPKWV
jgi:hypothetical protein